MTEQKRQCCMRVNDDYGLPLCSKPAKVEWNGKWYCTIHDPEYWKVKYEKKQAKYAAVCEADRARWAWQAARDKAVAGLTTQELKQVTPEMIRQVILTKTLGGEA